jgi:uncharacterized protein YegP (UPF0339 family)
MKIVVKKNKRGSWFSHIIGENGEIMYSSEAYSAKAACLKTAKMCGEKFGLSVVMMQSEK